MDLNPENTDVYVWAAVISGLVYAAKERNLIKSAIRACVERVFAASQCPWLAR